MQNEIKYIGFYDLPGQPFKRASALAAINKMDYIADALNRAGFAVHIVSPSWFTDANATWQPATAQPLPGVGSISFVPSYGTRFKIFTWIKIVWSLVWLFLWLIRHVKRQEKILVYHSPWLYLPVAAAKRITGFQLVLEVEEIYKDVSSINKYFERFEDNLLHLADAYLFSTDLLAEKLAQHKNYIVIYGIYKVYEQLAQPPADGKVHLLYAGIIDKHKAGAYNAIESAAYLPENYVLHIIGFGDTAPFIQRIEELNRVSKCRIVFDGQKSGEDYVKYCQQCHIGLSTQKMDGKYLESSFPSKILSYLAMNLRVVSCYVEGVSRSKLNPLVTYYYADEPIQIARAIEAVDLSLRLQSAGCLRELDKSFVTAVKILFDKQF